MQTTPTIMPEWLLQPLTQWPLEQVLRLQAQAYAPHLVEDADVLQAKIHAGPAACPLSWGMALVEAPHVLCGYAIACAWHSSLPPQWNHATQVPLAQADCLYVHDIAIAPQHHAQGLARQLLGRLLQQGRACGWQQAVLVAVQGAQRYWGRYGFAQAPAGPDVSGFGTDAVWMVRTL